MKPYSGSSQFVQTTINRGMLAVVAHWHEAHPRPAEAELQLEFHALSNRLMHLGDFISRCLDKKDARIEVFVNREKEAATGAIEIAEPLVEAGATATFTEKGFDDESFFSIASELAARYQNAGR
ncbi:MAG TPA: hypothetical protein VFU57_01480 [Candidatus Acidoferrales bacterium]|nr:hypothetical protein [Candidatus Acidoferrales bacterium]